VIIGAATARWELIVVANIALVAFCGVLVAVAVAAELREQRKPRRDQEAFRNRLHDAAKAGTEHGRRSIP
jgi:hypothetical protein